MNAEPNAKSHSNLTLTDQFIAVLAGQNGDLKTNVEKLNNNSSDV